MRLDFGEQSVAGLLGVSQQHAVVLLEEDGVIHGGVTHAQRTLHHDRLRRLPHAQNGHACGQRVEEGVGEKRR